MKTLKEYIEESLRYEILNQLQLKNESLSVFDGCENLLIDVIELLENNLDKSIIEHKFENAFFNKLILVIDRWNKTGNVQFAYIKKKDNFDIVNAKLNVCEIHCELPTQIKDNFFQRAKMVCRNQLLHEFTHAYQDYKEKLQIYIEKHISVIDLPNNVIKNLTNDEIGSKLNEFFKFTNRTDRNAYLAELYNSLLDNKFEILKSNDKVKTCLNIIKNTKIYAQFINMFSIKKDLEDKSKLKKYTIIYNISTNDTLSEGDVKSKLISSINKTQNKLNNVIGKQIVRALEHFSSLNETILVGDIENIFN